MSTNVDDYSLQRAIDGIMRTLKTITRADGFNTTPKVSMGADVVDGIPDGEFPSIRVELGDLEPAQQFFGGDGDTGKIYFDWPVFVWGYVKTSQGREALYRAGTALMADIHSAIYGNETMPDGAGQGTVLFANPAPIVFDMESFSTINKGYLVAEFRLVVAINRGVNP